MVNNFIGQLGQDMDQDDNRRYSQFANSLFNTGGNMGMRYFSGGNSFGTTPWGAIGSTAKAGYNAFLGKDDKDYSDLDQTIVYPLQGASKGAQFGPWGALGGALYGLGYSFKDDLGLKNSNFLTQLLFPLDMGDGGGLKIGGKPVTKGIL